MGKTNGAKWVASTKGVRKGSHVPNRITRGKGATAANPVPALEAKEKAGGLKGPYNG